MKIKLLPCPFCGSNATIHIGLNDFIDAEVQCNKCGASGGCFNDSFVADDDNSPKANEEEAAKHWNTRFKKESRNDSF